MKPGETAQPKSDDAAIQQRCEDAARRAMQSIELLQQSLPQTMASYHLRELFSAVVSILCRCLEDAKKADRDRDPLYHQLIALDLSKKAIEIADTLLSYARNDEEDSKSLLENALEWPAIMSIDPARDVRKVLKNPEGIAAKFYKPVLNDLGKHTWMHPTAPRSQGVFHQLAKDIVDVIVPSLGWAHVYRTRGLPWLLDFSIGSRFHILESSGPSAEDKYEWIAAIKYYLYLALAPEPERSRLREQWLELRVQAFKLFQPTGEDEVEVYRNFCCQNVLAAPEKKTTSTHRLIGVPAFLLEEPEWSPIWQIWWETTLNYEPSAWFGNCDPLTEWDDPAVVKLVEAKGVKGWPMAAFGRCVNAVLDSFLTLAGVRNGLKSIENRKTPIPKISSKTADDVLISAKLLANHLKKITANGL